jgi:hypothetical protein
MKCSPHRSEDKDLYKCFSKEELVKIAESYNSFTKICEKGSCYRVKKISNLQDKSVKELYKSLYVRFKEICKDEDCWVSLSFLETIPDKKFLENLKYFVFKPKMIGGRWKWLSTMDINYVLKQYEKFDDTFYFLGAQPCDFLKLGPNPLPLLPKGKKKIGLVLNWDTHDRSGSHWVAIFIETEDDKNIDYFDSTGDSPKGNKHIFSVLQFLKKQIPGSKIRINKRVHQRENTECGVYSIYFIIQRILGNDFKSITDHIIHDKDMNLFRNFIFNY